MEFIASGACSFVYSLIMLAYCPFGDIPWWTPMCKDSLERGPGSIPIPPKTNACILSDACTFFKYLKAEDRAHRHGQKRQVNVYIFCAKVSLFSIQYIFWLFSSCSPDFPSVGLILFTFPTSSCNMSGYFRWVTVEATQ